VVGDAGGERSPGEPGVVPPRMARQLEALEDELVDAHDKALHGLGGVTLGDVGALSWNVARGDTPLPILTLDWEVMLANVRLMQGYCDAHGCLLAPHGKTTMAPQVWAEQLCAGAWGITVASVRQLEVAVSFAVPKVLVANEVVGSHDLESLVAMLSTGETELFAFVDSVRGAALLAERLNPAHAPALGVFVELGLEGGRCGIRTDEELDDVVTALGRASPALRLVGVAGFEGIVNVADRATVDRFVVRLIDASRRLRAAADDTVLISAGGSVFFDRVVDRILEADLANTRLLLRSGAYVTHDDGYYAKSSPFAAHPRGEALQPSLELWSNVLSRPERGRAVLGFGRRDAPYDAGLPAVRRLVSADHEAITAGDGYAVTRLNDQHAYLDLPNDSTLQPGDIVSCGVSHPCSAFDRWRTVLTVDGDLDVVGAVRTYF
jgi:D-serine deaminase-like pyridoxal phosphate-dependent protein